MAHDINTIDTPAFVVNERIALNNIHKFQAHCIAAGLTLRPHIKTHKSVRFSKAQVAAGAVGITCQKIGEAEVMADGGVDDILITFNILGAAKLARLGTLSDRLRVLSVTVDNQTVISGLSETFNDVDNPLNILVECDTGAGRCGVQSPAEAAELAALITNAKGLRFAGLMTYPAVGGATDAAQFMKSAVSTLADMGIACPIISSGGSPDMWSASTDDIVTEYRIGTYIYNDRSLVERGTCTWADCAGHVIATVVSTPTKGRVIIDAGSKVLTSDLLGLDGFGHVVGHPDMRITGLSEEHGTLEGPGTEALTVGDRVKIVPNHVCVVSNMFDSAWLERENGDVIALPIDARGRVV